MVASEIEHAVSYIFNTVYTMLIELEIGNIPFKEPELLDCDGLRPLPTWRERFHQEIKIFIKRYKNKEKKQRFIYEMFMCF